MTREQIRERVLQCVDEVSPDGSTSYGLDYPIDRFLDEAAIQVLRLAPLHALGGAVVDFSLSPAMPLENGSGVVALPEGFLRLKSFRMKGWRRPVTVAYDVGSPMYLRQFNECARGGCAKPVAVIDGDTLCYFSLPDGAPHEIETAEAVVNVPAGEEFPERLVPPLAWLTACKVLTVLNENEAASDARAMYQEQMNLL